MRDSGRMLVTQAVVTHNGHGRACIDAQGQRWYTLEPRGSWVTVERLDDPEYKGVEEALDKLRPVYSYSSYDKFDAIHGRKSAPNTTQQQGDPMTQAAPQTLDNMTPEALRDLAKRATQAAQQQEAEAEKKKVANDTIPGVGETWKYGKRYFTVTEAGRTDDHMLLSCDEKGKDFRGWWIPKKDGWQRMFSTLGNGKADTHWPITHRRHAERVLPEIGKLTMIAQGIIPLDP